MFVALLTSSNTDTTISLRKQLKSGSFVPRILETIQQSEPFFNEDVIDDEAQMLAGIFKLVPLIRGDCELGQELVALDAVGLLARDFGAAPSLLLNAQWAAVEACVAQENAPVLIGNIENLIGLLVNDRVPFLAYKESVLGILSKLLGFDQGIETILCDRAFADILANIMRTFPEHAIAHAAVSKFLFAHPQCISLSRQILDKLLPIVMEGLDENGSIVTSAFSWNLLKQILESQTEHEVFQGVLEGLSDDCRHKFEVLDGVIQKPYGGEIPAAADGSADELTLVATPHQLIAILRLMAERSAGV
jgi:hypothetical protein